MKSKHFISIDKTPLDDLLEIFEVTARQKQTLATDGLLGSVCTGKSVGMLFQKPSLRTRVSFEVAISQIGGHVTCLGADEVQIGEREAVKDFARVISRYVDCIVARVFKHKHLVEIAKNSRVPLINALSDYAHPCQALADLQTMKECFGKWEGTKLCFVGDGNNVARSLAFLCAKLGVKFALAAPKGYSFDDAFIKRLKKSATNKNFKLEIGTDAKKLLRGADAVYADVWASMGQEEETAIREKAFKDYQLNQKLLNMAKPSAIALHCLPAHRGSEITDEVMDGPQAAVYDQAENRLHTERALLTLLMQK